MSTPTKEQKMWAIVANGKPIEWHDTKVSANRNVHFWATRLGVPVTVKKLTVNSARKNPTKAQKREKARKAGVQRRVATALAKYLKQVNPAAKLAGAKVEKLKGGVLKITPIKANRAKGCKR